MELANQLTERQAEVLAFIMRFIERNSFAPTFQEIAVAFGFTQNAAAVHLKPLQKKGYISMQVGTKRSIRVLKRPDGTPNNELETLRDENARLRDLLKRNLIKF